MNLELKQIYNDCALNTLSINTAKTNYMLVSSSRCHPKINITGIEQKDYIKYLRVYIDEHLNWQPQLQHVNTISYSYKFRNPFKTKILHRSEYTQTNLLCFNISLFELRYSCLGMSQQNQIRLSSY